MLWIDVADPVDDGVRHSGDEFFAGSCPAIAQRVQTDPGHHRGQPGVEVGYLPSIPVVAAGQPQPGLLYGVLCVVDRTQHAVGQRAQMRPGRLETCCQVCVCGHRPPASGSAHTLPSLKPDAPIPNARLKRPRRLPSVMMWVRPTSCALSKCARKPSNSWSLTSTGVRLIAVAYSRMSLSRSEKQVAFW